MTEIVSKDVEKGSAVTLFSAFISAVASEDMVTVEAQLADDIEWDMMPTGQTLKGKAEVMPWLKAGSASHKEPSVISDLASNDWGIFEYWNIGTVTEELVAFGNQQKWPWPGDPNSLIGRKYKVAQCFVWRLNTQGKICLMRQYLDTGSVWAQFK
jgi:SnoaL-like domain